ncbi:MAG: tRNA uridine-5-carboxymethylaminomethyl(34) synthesis GTPase MnmE [Hyphomicrobiales bacterium]|nr:tRNA uridine-5-carboxymethylaminomethyl(34) synthesis GTPase MnmE [Hyphomicrobiales bacterium]
MNDTIYALSSAPGRAGVAVFRVSGPGARRVVEAMCGASPKPRRASLRKLRHPVSRETLDRGLVLWLPGPASFTGEDMAELHTHGGKAVVTAVLEAFAAAGLRPAEAGEFTRRAFENGRFDLTEAEGLADLIDAETEEQRVQALRQADGALREALEGWRHGILQAQAALEAAIDFSDEADVPAQAVSTARGIVERLKSEIDARLADGRRGEILRDGLRVVIAGPPNAGKSSLLNALAGRDAAIVSETAGTTRDVIEVRLDLGGFPVIVSDTAGIREADDAVELEGVRRARAAARAADVVVWLSPVDAPQQPPASLSGATVWMVASKIDLGPKHDDGVSVVTGEGLQLLAQRLTLAAHQPRDEAPALITRARHRREIEAARRALDDFQMGDPDAVELRAEDLRAAAFALGRLTGRVDVEHVLGEIFSQFCIGK